MGFSKKQIQNMYRLSPLQNGILFHALKEDNKTAYFEQFSLHMEGALDPQVLEESIQDLVAKYDVLRTQFLYEKIKEPLQVVLKERNVRLVS
jgi:hypothetical protein